MDLAQAMASEPITSVAFAGALAVSGCGVGMSTQAGQFSYATPNLLISAVEGHGNDGLVLEGTTVCLESCAAHVNGLPEGLSVACSASPGGYGLLECFDRTVEGAVEDEAGCLVPLAGSSLVEVRYAPRSCPLVDEVREVALEPDVLSIRVVPASQATASFQPWPEELAAAWFEIGLLRSAEGGGAFPADWTPRPGAAMRVVDGGRATLFVQLLHAETGQKVARNADASDIDVRGAHAVEVGPPGFVTLTVTETDPVETRLRVREATWTATSVTAVPPATVDSLEIVVAQTARSTGAPAGPLGARAVLRDSAGELVFGAPVTWRVERGSVSLAGPDADVGSVPLPGQDYVFIQDDCLPPSRRVGPREVSLSASYLGLRDEVTFTWTGWSERTRDELAREDARFEPGPRCPTADAGCACASASGAPAQSGAAILLGCVAAILAVRRRHLTCQARSGRRAG